MKYTYDDLKRIGSTPKEIAKFIRHTQLGRHNARVRNAKKLGYVDIDYETLQRQIVATISLAHSRAQQVTTHTPYRQ